MRGLGTSAAALAGAVAGLCLLNSPLRGQQAETVELGESGRPISTVVRLEAPGGTDGARAEFEIRPAEGVRLFGPPTGSVPVREGRVLLPVTFVTGRGESAGSVEAVRVVFRFPGGETAERTVRARVPRELEMEALFTDERSTTVEPGDWVEVSYRVANHGNGPDTVRLSVRVDRDRWEVAAYPRRLVLAPGEAHEGRMRVRAPREARPGSAARAVLRAEGGGEPRRATRTLRVVRSQGWVPGVEELPATVFLGTTTSRRGEDELDSVVGSIHAQGRLNEKTRVALEARLSDDPVTAPAFRGEVRGSSLRLSVERPDWEVRLGDVRGRSRPLAQSHLNARGIDATWEAGGVLEAELLAGVPADRVVPLPPGARGSRGRGSAAASGGRPGTGRRPAASVSSSSGTGRRGTSSGSRRGSCGWPRPPRPPRPPGQGPPPSWDSRDTGRRPRSTSGPGRSPGRSRAR